MNLTYQPYSFNESRIPSLDGLRAIFVLFVILGHSGWGAPSGLGVTGFFVLSGFLITYLLLKENDAKGEVSIKKFYIRRSLRIFPAYYAFLLFSFSLDYYKNDYWSVDQAFSAITYVMNYYNAINGHPVSSIAHSWSLAVEEQFYLLWPFVFLFFARSKLMLFSLLASIVAWRSFAYLFVFNQQPHWIYNAFDTRFDSLLVGALVAFLLVKNREGILASVNRLPCWFPLVLLFLAILSTKISIWHYTIGLTIEALLLALAIIQIVVFSRHSLWSWLEWRAFVWLGILSYSMYLYHSWGITLGKKIVDISILNDIMGIVCTAILAAGSYYVVERPMLRLKHKFG